MDIQIQSQILQINLNKLLLNQQIILDKEREVYHLKRKIIIIIIKITITTIIITITIIIIIVIVIVIVFVII
jgi:hypothetical protein